MNFSSESGKIYEHVRFFPGFQFEIWKFFKFKVPVYRCSKVVRGWKIKILRKRTIFSFRKILKSKSALNLIKVNYFHCIVSFKIVLEFWKNFLHFGVICRKSNNQWDREGVTPECSLSEIGIIVVENWCYLPGVYILGE